MACNFNLFWRPRQTWRLSSFDSSSSSRNALVCFSRQFLLFIGHFFLSLHSTVSRPVQVVVCTVQGLWPRGGAGCAVVAGVRPRAVHRKMSARGISSSRVFGVLTFVCWFRRLGPSSALHRQWAGRCNVVAGLSIGLLCWVHPTSVVAANQAIEE